MERTTALEAALVALAALVGALAYPAAPETVPIHWNAAGAPDGYAPKAVGLFFVPALAAFVLGLLRLVFRADPRTEGEPEGAGALLVVVAGFLAYLQVVVALAALGRIESMNRFLFPGLGALFVGVGVWLPRVEPNWFAGIRTPWTMESDTVWRRTHRVTGRLFVLAGVLTAAGAFVPDYAVWLCLGSVTLAALGGSLYSFVDYRKRN
jgi:uncharacterized membrane protein